MKRRNVNMARPDGTGNRPRPTDSTARALWRAASALAGLLATACAAAGAGAAEAARGMYEDPLGRYRFSFEGDWRVAAGEEDPVAPGHFYLVRRGVVVAELIVTSRPFPAPSRLSDFVKAEVEALDAEPDMFRVSLTRGLTISAQPAVRLIARIAARDEDDLRHGRTGPSPSPPDTFAVQYWFTGQGRLWSLLVVTTATEEQRSKVVFDVEKSVVASFKVLGPDEVAQAITTSKKVARLGSGLAELTVPEAWTLLKVEEDAVAAEFDKGRLYLFAVTDHELGGTLKEIAGRFVEKHAGLEAPTIRTEGECDVEGEPGYYVILDGEKDRLPLRAQLIVLTRAGDAFFLYGVCEADAWPQARPWITAAQYTITLLKKAPASPPEPVEENPD